VSARNTTRRHLAFYPPGMSQLAVIGAILTGGNSSRMGHPKVSVSIGDNTMGSLVSAAVSRTLSTVVAVGRHPVSGITRLDDGGGAGPVAALTGLAAVWDELNDPDGVFITAVDHPWLDSDTIARLVERFDTRPVVPVHQESRQVMCAIYPRTFVTGIPDDTPSLQAALDRIEIDEVSEKEWRLWGEDARSWFSADQVEDLDIGLTRFGPPGT
jgi:molybdopterin-guanine dinucleotide biosynthesis protein A